MGHQFYKEEETMSDEQEVRIGGAWLEKTIALKSKFGIEYGTPNGIGNVVGKSINLATIIQKYTDSDNQVTIVSSNGDLVVIKLDDMSVSKK